MYNVILSGGHSEGLSGGHSEGLSGHSEGLSGGHSEGLSGGHSEGLSGGHSEGLSGVHGAFHCIYFIFTGCFRLSSISQYQIQLHHEKLAMETLLPT
jgi:hypothetical protein